MYGTNLLLIGTVTSPALSRTFVEAGISPGPAEIVQKYLITGLDHAGLKSVEVISGPRIPAYPGSSVKRVREDEWSIGQVKIHSAGFLNLEGLGFLDRAGKIRKAALEWAGRHGSESKTVLIYSMHSPFLAAARAVKERYPDTVTAIIVPDLPQYMSVHKGIKKFLKEGDMSRINRLMPCVDRYVLYTKYMAEYFRLDAGKWTVLEGLMDVKRIVPNDLPKNRKRPLCLYAGRLDRRYAVDKMIEAFGSLPEADLHLYGSPSDAAGLKDLIGLYDNVRYMGTLSQDDVFQKMREADLLLNPRPSNIDLSRYSCPSKTFEYMASGTPVLMTKLPGLPEEYYPYLYFFEEESAEGFAKGIRAVLESSKEELHEKGRLAQEFLVKEKNADLQVGRIVDFICG